jgi:hypothetical protein
MLRRLLPALIALVPCAAAASSVVDEVGVGVQPQSSTSPQSGFVYERLGGEATLSDYWSLRGDLVLTHDDATQGQTGAIFGSSGGNIPFVDLGTDVDPSDHFSFGGELDFSPRSGQLNDAPVSLNGAQYDGDLRSSTSSVGFVVSASADTAGDSNWENAGTVALGMTHLSTTQQLARVASGSRTVDLNLLRASCRSGTVGAASRPFCQVIDPNSSDLTQGRVTVNADTTIFVDNDLGLTGSYYFYDKDPSSVGFYAIAASGRVNAQLGQGMAIAPYLWTLRPDLAHRFFHRLRVDVFYQYGQYWPGEGYSQSVGGKVEFKFNRSWKAWLSGYLERDVDGSGNPTVSGTLSLGARYKF